MTTSIISNLERNSQVFHGLLSNIPKEQHLFREAPDKWNLLEIVCHLVDEEKEDFRMRVSTTLEHPGQLPPPIDPPGWVTSRQYGQRDYEAKLAEFQYEREASIAYLRGLESPNWENSYQHPQLVELSALHFLTNWLAHDFHHIRQINAINYAFLKSRGVDLSYAGNWKA